jgi:hypothetical protein
MNKKNSPGIKDVSALRKQVMKLDKVPAKKLDDAICDIIDMRGYSLAVLLDAMPNFSAEIQLRIARKIEDFLYFHPESGKKILGRLKKALDVADPLCRASLFSALADITDALEDNDYEAGRLGTAAVSILNSDADLARKSKAIEVMVKAGETRGIPLIIKTMINSIVGLDQYQNYQFIETALLSLKRLGGEEVIKLLINPASDAAIKQLRVEWRNVEPQLLNDTLSIMQKLDSDFAQVMLKVVDLSDFNLPFVAMLKEGAAHSDKWVRQVAVEALQKATEALNPEVLSRMLNDSAAEVRLMAASSLGAFSREQTGEILEELAQRSGESLEIRLNALYALYAQKNNAALTNLCETAGEMTVSLNAQGLAALHMPKEEGRRRMLETFLAVKSELLNEAGHYLMEMLEADDIKFLIASHAESSNETHRERLIIFMRSFLEKKSGPKLDLAVSRLGEAEQKAVKMLVPVG